tara:strand:+ start:1503 stop:2000 length:498 start_codon:yes stop_codon:yes gene_type:complete
MLKRFSIIVLALSFLVAGPMGAKKKTGYNTLPGKGKGKQEKPMNQKGLTYKEVALELTDGKNLTAPLSKKEQEAVSAFIAGKRKGGTFKSHLTKAMKKHKCYVGKSKKESKNKFSKWPSTKDSVKWFDLVCKEAKSRKKDTSGKNTNASNNKYRENARRGQNQSN